MIPKFETGQTVYYHGIAYKVQEVHRLKGEYFYRCIEQQAAAIRIRLGFKNFIAIILFFIVSA